MVQRSVANCPFCESTRDVSIYASSNNFRALYNIAPILPGHSLIIPKWHVQSMTELSEAELGEMMVFARDMVKILSRQLKTKSFNFIIQEGAEAGQTVNHLHLHLIPRRIGDLPRPGDWFPLLEQNEKVVDSETRPRLSPTQMKKIVANLREVVARELPARGFSSE